MTDEQIFNYLERQITKLLRSKKINFNQQQLEQWTNRFLDLENQVLKKYTSHHNFPNMEIEKSAEETSVFLKSLLVSYAVPNIFRYVFDFSLTNAQGGKIIYESTELKVFFDTLANDIVINGQGLDLMNSNGIEINNALVNTIIAIDDDAKAGNKLLSNHQPEPLPSALSASAALSLALNSNKLSSANKTYIIEKVLQEIDNDVHGTISSNLTRNNQLQVSKVWKTKKDNRVRPSHKKMHGKKVAINEQFDLNGYRANFPRDKNLPAKEKDNCRCFLSYE